MLGAGCINRGVVERFIAPVLKTGEPLRVPGVRIPPPLLSTYQTKSKPQIRSEFGVFVSRTNMPLKFTIVINSGVHRNCQST